MELVGVTSLVHDVFGEIEFDPEDEMNEWESRVPWGDGVIDVDITFGGAAMDYPTLDRLARYVTDLAAFDQKAHTAMLANVDDEDSAVRDYMEHHLDELGLIRPVFGHDDRGAVGTEVFLAALGLVRVGLYSGTDISKYAAVFDYSIGRKHTQYLVVVNFDEDGRVAEICMES
jgi:hypothetical protein